MNILGHMQAEQRGESYVDPFDWKANVKHDRTMQQLGVTSDALHHLEWKLPKVQGVEVSEWLHDGEHKLADFGIGNKPQEWPNFEEEENVHAAWEVYTGDPIYDEEQGEGQEYWPEQEFILAD